MNPIVKNILAVVAGIILGMIVNFGLVWIGSKIIAAPAGVDPMDPASIANSLHLFGPQHFVFPFLGHALGTLSGAILAAWLAVSRKLWYGLGIGIFFLLGGIANLSMIPTPTWFAALDLLLAYVPMGWLGGRIAANR